VFPVFLRLLWRIALAATLGAPWATAQEARPAHVQHNGASAIPEDPKAFGGGSGNAESSPSSTGTAVTRLALRDFSGCGEISYPPAAARSQAQGTTEIEVELASDGKVIASKIVRSSGRSREHKILDEAAARSLSTCVATGKLRGRTGRHAVAVGWKLD
jgi:TonB family protein